MLIELFMGVFITMRKLSSLIDQSSQGPTLYFFLLTTTGCQIPEILSYILPSLAVGKT